MSPSAGQSAPPAFVFRACRSSACALRYPAAANEPRAALCPRCGASTSIVATVEAPTINETVSAPTPAKSPRPRVEALLDNVRSLYNVGSIFRTADGAGIHSLHLCGITATPENPKVAKTALGAETAVAWRYHADAVATVTALQQQGYRIIVLETGPAAVPIFSLPHTMAEAAARPWLLVVGNEVAGIDPGVLALADVRAAIPMAGQKRSLNVATAFGIAAYALTQL